ncbi:MAG: hypothetical protein ABR962_10555 [Candidatus Bathyarchaeia archaeon]|jgi:hypothetical protein
MDRESTANFKLVDGVRETCEKCNKPISPKDVCIEAHGEIHLPGVVQYCTWYVHQDCVNIRQPKNLDTRGYYEERTALSSRPRWVRDGEKAKA